jgi:hypothetical protein
MFDEREGREESGEGRCVTPALPIVATSMSSSISQHEAEVEQRVKRQKWAATLRISSKTSRRRRHFFREIEALFENETGRDGERKGKKER